MENGYKVWGLLQRMKKTLECAICLDLLSDPYSAHCNHPFCRLCITTVISSNKHPNCPLCKEPISRRSIHENSRLAEIVDSVKGLEDAVMKESGIASTPPLPIPHCQSSRGTPGIILHSLLHPTPQKAKPGPSRQESLSSSDAASPRSPPLNFRRKRKRCLSTRNTRRPAVSFVYATRSKSKAAPLASGPAPTLHGSSSAPCLKSCCVSYDTSSSAEEVASTGKRAVDGTVSPLATDINQEEMEIDTLPTLSPHNGVLPTGSPPTKPLLTSTTPPPIDPLPAGPPPTGSPPTGSTHTEQPPTDPLPAGPPPSGSTPTEQPSTGPPPTKPLPTPTALHSPKLRLTVPAAIVLPTIVPSSARPTADGECTDQCASGALSGNITVERAGFPNGPQAAPHLTVHPSCAGGVQSSNSSHRKEYSSPVTSSPNSGSSTDSLSPPLLQKQPALTQTVAATPELLDTTVSPEILVLETLDPEPPINPGATQATWTQVAISDTLDFVAEVVETPLIACHPSSTSAPSKTTGIHCSMDLMGMPAVSQSDGIQLSTQYHCESVLSPSSQPQLPADCIPDTIPSGPSQRGTATRQYDFRSPAIPLQSHSVCATQALSPFGKPLRSCFRRKQKTLQAVEEEEVDEEGFDFRPVVEVTPQKTSDSRETDCHPPAVVLPGLQMPASPFLPSLPKSKALRLSQQREEGSVSVDQPTPPWFSQDPPTPPGFPQDPPTPPGVHQDPPTPPGVHQDPPTSPGVHQDPPTPPGVHQDPPTPPGVHQDPPTPPGVHQDQLIPPEVPHGCASDSSLPPVMYTDVSQLGTAASDEPEMPVCDGKLASPLVPVKAENTSPTHCTEPLPHGVDSPSILLSPATNSSLNELSICTMAESLDTQALVALQWTLHEKQKEIEELDDILKKADVHMEDVLEDSAVVYEQQSELQANGEEQASTHSTHVPEGEQSSMLIPRGKHSSLLLNEGDAGNGSVGGNCVSTQVVTADLQDALDQLLGDDVTDVQDGRVVGTIGLEVEGMTEQTDTDCHSSRVPGSEQAAEKGSLQTVEAAEEHVSTQAPLEDYSGVSTEVVVIPASLHTPACDAEGSVVTASQSAETHSPTVPFTPDQEEVHVILDSLPVATRKGCGNSSVIQTIPTMSAVHAGEGRREGGEVQVSMAVVSGDAEIEGKVDNVCSSSSHQPKGDVTTLQEEMRADEIFPVSSPPLLEEWRESLSQGTCRLLQESRQLIRDIRASRARSLTPRTDGAPTCVETTSNIEGQSTLAIVQNLEAFITGGIKQGGANPVPTPLTSGSSSAYEQEGGGGGRATADESLPAAKRCMMQTTAGWQSARRSSKLQFGPSSKAVNMWAQEGVREESRTKPKRKSLPEFWQPATDKKKKLEFFVPRSAASVTYPSAPNGTTVRSHGDHPPLGRSSTSSVSAHGLEGQASLNNSGEPRTVEQLGKHGSIGKSSAIVPVSPVLGRQYSLVASGLRKTQMQSLKEFVRQFDLRLASTFNQCTTHVVIATDENRQCPRTVKYLQGVAGGRWIVTFDWVSQSLLKGSLLPEKAFEVSSDSVTSVLGVPRIARTHHNGKGLFHGCAMMLCGEFKEMTRDQIAQLLKLSGAQLISKGDIPSSSSKLSIIISDLVCSPQREQVPSNWDVVSSDWVIDSLSSFRVLPLDGHLLQQKAT